MWTEIRAGTIDHRRNYSMRPKCSVSLSLLCAALLALMLAGCPGCRRQSGHAVTIEVKEGPGSDPVSEPTSRDSDIVFEDWVSAGESAHALSGQLLLTVSSGYDSGKGKHTTNLQIKIADQGEEDWNDLVVGGRKTLEFDSVEYMVDVLEANKYGARIAIVRKR